MISLSDILKLLDQWPSWKAVREAPKQIAALEARIAALETALAAPGAQAVPPCPICGAGRTVEAVTDDPVFGPFGVKRRTLVCANGHRDAEQWDPRGRR